MRNDLRPDYRPGDVLTADVIDQIIEGQGQLDVRGDGINVRFGANRQLQLSATDGVNPNGFPCTSDGTITARSGNTPGKGLVHRLQLDPSSGDLVDTGVTETVYSQSSTTGGIPSGTHGNANYDDQGILWFQTVDCGN